MRTTASCLVALALLAASFTASASETRELSGHQYVNDDGRWLYLDATGKRFQVNDRVITVKLAPGTSRGAEEALHEDLGGEVLRRAITGFIDVEIDAGRDVFEALDAYLASELVEIAEPNTFGEYTIIPDDPSYGTQYQYPITDAEEAWDVTTGDPVAVVAILDSGTEFTHVDLGTGADAYQNIWLNDGEDAWADPTNPATGNGIDDDGNGYVDDWKGYDFANNNNDGSGPFFHGTAVAGCTGAKTNNGTGVAGMAGGWNGPGARLMVGGVGDAAPNGAVLDDAILYAGENGAQVVQMSLSVGPSAAIDAAIQMVYDVYNMTLICSSGNGGTDTVGYPSSNPNVIAVGATDAADLRAGFSQHGPDLEVSAPGVNIFTTDLNNGYLTTGGTSFSSPLTSGVVALMISVNPSLTNAEIRQILHDTADKVGPYDYNWNASMPGHSFELGYGRINAEAAVLASNAGFLFADGFESGDTLSWSSTVQ